MLPLDFLTDEAKKAFEAAGKNIDELGVAIKLDLNFFGEFGETWLALDFERKRLVRLDVESGSYDEFELALLASPYIDNFTSSNRLLAVHHSEAAPDKEALGEAFEEAEAKYKKEGRTTVLAYCTNACKRKFFAFLDVMKRTQNGEEVREDDQIFEQFNKRCPKCGKIYKDQNRLICDDCVKGRAIFLRMLGYFGDFKPQIITVVLCMFLTSAISLLNPIINGLVLFDNVISETGKYHKLEMVFIVVGVIFGMALLSVGINIIQNRANAHMSTRVTKKMKTDVFTALSGLSLSYFNKNPTGRLITRVNYDAVRINSFYIDGIPNLIVNSLNFIGLTIFLFTINWQLTLIVFIPVPIIVLIFKYKLPKLYRTYTKRWRRSSALNATLGDTLNGVRVVKAFAKEAEEAHRFGNLAKRLSDANLQVNLVTLTIFPFISLLISMSSQAIWGFGGINVMGGHMTYGEFTTYLGYLGMIFGPLNFFTNFTNMLTDTINAAQRIFETLDMVPEVADSPDAKELESIKGDIEFNRVCFHYNPNRPILKDVNLKIKAGQHIGLVGHTGSGKSTIANLILRMYDVISGSITIDGINVKDIKTKSLRKNISIVSQEIFLFYGTIADNIRYARPDATMAEVIEASRAANAHEFIMQLPNGYETMVGTGTRSLSGGERQRISIARALLMKPSLLILDEATAAMDTETERLISAALEKLIEGRTTITIAHRLSTLKDCDYIFAIEHGEIAEEGTIPELLEKKGVYYKLYTLQSEAMQKVMAGE